jgi:hypothetical protein
LGYTQNPKIMKLFLTFVAVVLISSCINAQSIYVSGGTSTGIGNNTTNTNVGIGISNPTSFLHLNTSANTVLNIQSTSTGNNYTSLNLSPDAGTALAAQGFGSGYTSVAGFDRAYSGAIYSSLQAGLSLSTRHTSGYMTFHTGGSTPTERMRIAANGNIGIGTNSPSALLHVLSSTATVQLESSSSTAATLMNFINNSGAAGVSVGTYGSGYTSGTYDRASGASLATTSSSGGAGGIGIAARNSAGIITFHTGGNTERARIDASGNLGIGTSSPANLLHILSSSNPTVQVESTSATGTTSVILYNNSTAGGLAMSTFGSGYTNASNSANYDRASGASIYTTSTSGGAGGIGIAARNSAGVITFHTGGNTQRMIIDASGNVGIGAMPDQKLTVDGTVRAEEVRVEAVTGFPDFVFDESYKLASLEEVEKYIREHKHLPEMPSAAEVKENGLLLAEMNMKLLQKIEELTLHLIELKKEVDQLKSEKK